MILDSLAGAEAELAQQSQLVEELISDLERRCEWSDTELLQVGRSRSPQSAETFSLSFLVLITQHWVEVMGENILFSFFFSYFGGKHSIFPH